VVCQHGGRPNPAVNDNTNTWWLFTRGSPGATRPATTTTATPAAGGTCRRPLSSWAARTDRRPACPSASRIGRPALARRAGRRSRPSCGCGCGPECTADHVFGGRSAFIRVHSPLAPAVPGTRDAL
jgi:hypothetical protein